MLGKKGFLQAAMGIIVAASLAACGTPPILIKPHSDQVKKVALVNVYANRGVRSFDGASKMAGLTALASMVTKKEGKDEGEIDFGGTRLVKYGVATFDDEFAKIEGWDVVPSDQVLASKAYQDFVKRADDLFPNDAMRKLNQLSYLTPDKMVYLVGEGREGKSKQMLTQLAQELGVDAVAVMEMDVAYTASTSVGGTGTASAYAGVSLLMVNRYGDYAIRLPKVMNAKNHSMYRKRSDDTTAMVAGEILYNSSVEQLFQDSIRKSLLSMRDKIDGELNGKK